MNEPGFHVLIVDDEEEYREVLAMLLEGKGYILDTAASGEEALSKLAEQEFHLVLTDLIMGGMDGIQLLERIKARWQKTEVMMITGYGSIENAVTAIKKGAFSYFIKGSDPSVLLAEVEKLEKIFRIHRDKEKRDVLPRFQGYCMVQSANPQIQKIMDIIDKAAISNVNFLITGESGTGKEVFARYIHDQSRRKGKSFVAVNCQALSESLLESELFGHEKGAFTGAGERRIGRFEEANGGTLFLDEIGEMPLNIQVKLLRVLETRSIERIGSNRSLDIDLRLVSATNRCIDAAIREGTFREDLFYRINTIILEIPPLRDRREDLPALIDYFIGRYSEEYQKAIQGMDDEVRRFLLHHGYPGNIRELKNIVERLVVLAEDGILHAGDLPESRSQEADGSIVQPGEIKPLRELKREVERRHIEGVLNTFGGNISEAARHLEISRRQLFNKVVEYGLKY